MSPLIEIDGDWQNTYATVYVDSKYKSEELFNAIDMNLVNADGHNCLIGCGSDWNGMNLRVALSPEYENRSFIFVWIKSPYKDFDESKVRANVPIEITRTHSVFGWIVYMSRVALKAIGKWWKDGE